MTHASRRLCAWLISDVSQEDMKPLLVALLAFAFTGCGFFKSGTWKDDPKNWKRAFSENAPATIVIYRSYYERSPHPVFKEFAFFFEIDDSPAARRYLGFDEVVKRTSLRLQEVDFIALKDTRADWFPSGDSAGDFEVWRPQDRSFYAVIVDKGRRRIFLTDRM